jgi:hypothetical protein
MAAASSRSVSVRADEETATEEDAPAGAAGALGPMEKDFRCAYGTFRLKVPDAETQQAIQTAITRYLDGLQYLQVTPNAQRWAYTHAALDVACTVYPVKWDWAHVYEWEPLVAMIEEWTLWHQDFRRTLGPRR